MNDATTAAAIHKLMEQSAPKPEQPNPFDPDQCILNYRNDPPPPEFIIPNLIPFDVGVISGASGTSKSTLIMNLSHSVVLDIPWCGFKIARPGPVVYLSAEDTKAVFEWRTSKLAANLTPEQHATMDKWFRFVDCRRVSPRQFVVPDNGGHLVPTDMARWLIEAFAPMHPSLIVVDPWRFFAPPERTVNEGIAQTWPELHRLSEETGAAILIIGHVNKSDVLNNTIRQNATSGGAALGDHARFEFQLVRIHKHNPTKMPRTLTPWHFAADGTRSVMGLYIHKVNNAPHDYRPIYIARSEWEFTHHPHTGEALTMEEAMAQDEAVETGLIIKLYEFVLGQQEKQKYFRVKELGDSVTVRNSLGISRDDLRALVARMIETGWLEEFTQATGRSGAQPKYVRARPSKM